ncbi:MAG TPA: DUF4012 domain-containing protein, partial [Candidatus Gracilibacteria bacterium]|nr:DUF4012 domain-containing protein [Candidatus Gracilibacteria bacterium]
MARKVVRDIEKKGLLTISLKKEGEEEQSPRAENALDCSTILQKKKSVRRAAIKAGKAALKDIAPAHEKHEQVFFFHITEDVSQKSGRVTELMRLVAGGLTILLLVNVINIYYRGVSLKDDVVASAYSGYEDLLSGAGEAGSANFPGAEGAFTEAQRNFDVALETVAFLQTNENYFFVREKTVESIQGLLEAAKSISLAGQDFARGIQSLSELPTLFLQENGLPGKTDVTGKASLTERLKSDLEFLNKAQAEIESASINLARVSPDVLPPTFRERLGVAQEKVGQINGILRGARAKIPAFLDLLGDQYPHRYLILLQNDAEARPTGGFIGSYIIADLNDGYITKMEFHDIYELDGQLQEVIPPPPDIARVSENWRMRDANYSPDYAVSAEKVAWFLQKQKGPSVDTVIALNQSFIADLLEVTGPIQLSSLNAPLNKDNFQLVLSYIIETKLSGEEAPKKILEELIPAFQKKVFSDAP